MSDFYELALEVQRERLKRENEELNKKKRTGSNIYANFCAWCNAFKDEKSKTDVKVFNEFIAKENVEIDFYQKKCIAEKYFGYKYEYDYNDKKWRAKKNG